MVTVWNANPIAGSLQNDNFGLQNDNFVRLFENKVRGGRGG